MKKPFWKPFVGGSIALLAVSTLTSFAADMQERIHAATEILAEKQRSDEPIPKGLLDHAKGVAIFTVTKAGFGIGGQGGEGIVILRRGNMTPPAWTAPSAFNVSGASIGAQIGVTENHYIVVLNTDDAVNHFTRSGKLNWDATATGTAGADSATEKVSTTDLERREVVVYKDTNGLFGGATLGGTSIERKDSINEGAYGNGVQIENILSGAVPAPASAGSLYRLL